jgi:hypothetical protein
MSRKKKTASAALAAALLTAAVMTTALPTAGGRATSSSAVPASRHLSAASRSGWWDPVGELTAEGRKMICDLAGMFHVRELIAFVKEIRALVRSALALEPSRGDDIPAASAFSGPERECSARHSERQRK